MRSLRSGERYERLVESKGRSVPDHVGLSTCSEAVEGFDGRWKRWLKLSAMIVGGLRAQLGLSDYRMNCLCEAYGCYTLSFEIAEGAPLGC